MLDALLRAADRRYRLPGLPGIGTLHDAPAATALAVAIDAARAAAARHEQPGARLEPLFTDALSRLIHAALRPQGGDAVFQAMVLRHQAAQVREYASLSAHIQRDRRTLRQAVNAIAHPARHRRLPAGPLRDALAALHASAHAADWPALADAVHGLLSLPLHTDAATLADPLARLRDSPELQRLLRRDALAADLQVRQYQALTNHGGPQAGSASAAAQGAASQRRGLAMETRTAQVLEALAARLNSAGGASPRYRVATSMQVPAAIDGERQRAKSEWDAVLLKQDAGAAPASPWDICLLAEAKASVDAAATDLPRLLRGMRLLAHAAPGRAYPFQTAQETVLLSGSSMNRLSTDAPALARTVLYCCDAPAEAAPRLLSAASRMQLLSAPASLEFGGALAQGRPMPAQALAPVWQQLRESPRWQAVLHQYPMLRQARELMVHTDDLLAAVSNLR